MGQLVAMSDVRDSSLLWFAVTSASWGSRAPSRLPRLVRLLPGQKEVRGRSLGHLCWQLTRHIHHRKLGALLHPANVQISLQQ